MSMTQKMNSYSRCLLRSLFYVENRDERGLKKLCVVLQRRRVYCKQASRLQVGCNMTKFYIPCLQGWPLGKKAEIREEEREEEEALPLKVG